MTHIDQISIDMVRNDKVQVEIKSSRGVRKFDIIANKDGLKISSNENLAVMPVTSNTLMVDTVSDVDSVCGRAIEGHTQGGSPNTVIV
ncbi:MAG: hypothetical protein A2283_20465 [Lentisphaerae bacterium RIFOXYA12_FULL_48_11]|nr:MAG: hypothetical protein A2283_20465 [Lentisphaerae bacterium RIFOXYA12_FULL_48_11]